MKEIYIVLTHTGTTLSRIIKYYTKEKYIHVSIGLDSDLKELYSFGRLNPYNPYKGGFIHEELNKGTFARFRNTIGAVYSLKLTAEQYEKINCLIKTMKLNKDKYKFNIIGLFLVSINPISPTITIIIPTIRIPPFPSLPETASLAIEAVYK